MRAVSMATADWGGRCFMVEQPALFLDGQAARHSGKFRTVFRSPHKFKESDRPAELDALGETTHVGLSDLVYCASLDLQQRHVGMFVPVEGTAITQSEPLRR